MIGFTCINLDLRFGVPHCTPESFAVDEFIILSQDYMLLALTCGFTVIPTTYPMYVFKKTCGLQ